MPMPSYDERRAALGEEAAWTKREVALYLGVSERTVDSLPIPRAVVRGIGSGRGSVRFVPDTVRRWLVLQSTPQLPPSV
jgi:hypothetical protein